MYVEQKRKLAYHWGYHGFHLLKGREDYDRYYRKSGRSPYDYAKENFNLSLNDINSVIYDKRYRSIMEEAYQDMLKDFEEVEKEIEKYYASKKE